MKIVWVSKPETQTRNPGLALDSNPKPGFEIWRVFAISSPGVLELGQNLGQNLDKIAVSR